MSFAVRVCKKHSEAQHWSVGAFVLSAFGFALSITFILGSETDTAQVRWWLVVAPLFATALPLVLARRGVRLAAMLALGAWCVLGLFSIGILQVPALGAAVAAVLKEAE